MQSILPQWLIQAIGILLIAVVAVAVLFLVFKLICAVIKTIKMKRFNVIAYTFISILCVAIAAVSWIFNMGWLRLILTLVAFPFVHAVLFVVIIAKSSAKVSLSVNLKKYIILSHITYIASYLLLPDGGDYGEMSFFFALIESNIVGSVAMFIALACFAAHAACLFACVTETKKLKSQTDTVVADNK